MTNNADTYKLEANGGKKDEPFLFVSYSRSDSEYVHHAMSRLINKGYRIWFDQSINEEGELNFNKVISRKIEDCYAILLFVSANSMNSKYCGLELMEGYKNDKKIYSFAILESNGDDMSTIRVEDVIPAVLQKYIMDDKHINQYEKSPYDSPDNLSANKKWISSIDDLIKILPEETLQCLETNKNNDTILKCRDNRKNINIPDNIKTIGEGAFAECEKLENINFSSTKKIMDNAFNGCDHLKEINLPNSVTYIGEYAFKDCDNSSAVKIPQDIDYIGEGAFDGCEKLTEINLPNTMHNIPTGLFNGCVSLKNVSFPENLTTIGESAFENCKNLVIHNGNASCLPETLKIIDDQAFANCKSFVDIKLPKQLCKLGKNCFRGCDNLETITIGKNVSFIGASPFRDCKKLRSIFVDSANKSFRSSEISTNSDEHMLFNKNRSGLICFPANSSAVSYEIPDSVTTVCEWSFAYCDKLRNITISDSVDEIKENAFYKCTGLEKIFIPDGVSVIDDMAFQRCINLRVVVIPPSVTRIGYAVFNGCRDLTIICEEDSEADRAFNSDIAKSQSITCKVCPKPTDNESNLSLLYDEAQKLLSSQN